MNNLLLKFYILKKFIQNIFIVYTGFIFSLMFCIYLAAVTPWHVWGEDLSSSYRWENWGLSKLSINTEKNKWGQWNSHSGLQNSKTHAFSWHFHCFLGTYGEQFKFYFNMQRKYKKFKYKKTIACLRAMSQVCKVVIYNLEGIFPTESLTNGC